MQTIDCELIILVDSCGDYACGEDEQSARDAYEDDVQSLASCDGFRLVKLTLKIELPIVAELTGTVSGQDVAILTEAK